MKWQTLLTGCKYILFDGITAKRTEPRFLIPRVCFTSSDGDALTAEQIENIIEFLPTKEERSQLEKYMLEGTQDAAEKFDGLCECEKFMVSMMTVKHAKRKVSALLFKLQFISCLQSIAEGEERL